MRGHVLTSRQSIFHPATRGLLSLLAAILLGSGGGVTFADTGPPFALPSPAELAKLRSAVVVTKKGKIYLELFPEDAPWHVANFKYLADKGFYKGTLFHLVYPGYVIQGGGPKENPTGGPGYTVPPEFNSREHTFGVVGMARLPDDLNPGRESNGSQFHIVIGDAPHMNGSYTIFGRVSKGSDIVRSLSRGDSIEDVIVYVAAP